MMISIKSKRTPPPRQGTFNHRLIQGGRSLAVFAISLMLAACPSPGGGGGTTTPNGGGTTNPDGGTPTPPAPDPEKPTPEPPTPPPKPKTWHVTTFAGGGSVGTDGIGAAAGFGLPYGIAQSGDTLYVTDFTEQSIRTVHTTTARVGTIVTGGDGTGGHVNGAGTSARFNYPSGIAAAAGSTLYVADFLNHRIREVRAGADAAATQVDTLAGGNMPGNAEGAGTTARFNGPRDAALSGTTLYVADQNNHSIRAIDLASPNKTVSTLAGGGTTGDYIDGADTVARFNNPRGLALSGNTLYVADYGNHCIRAIDLAGKTVSTLAGSCGTPEHANGVGTAARFDGPTGIAVSGGTLYVADTGNHRIRAIDIASRTVRDIAGDGTAGSTNGIGTAARLDLPTHVVVSGSTLYVTSRRLIRKLEYREAGS